MCMSVIYSSKINRYINGNKPSGCPKCPMARFTKRVMKLLAFLASKSTLIINSVTSVLNSLNLN